MPMSAFWGESTDHPPALNGPTGMGMTNTGLLRKRATEDAVWLTAHARRIDG